MLPLLPVVIASALQNTRAGPVALASGLIVSFVLLGVGVTASGHLIGVDERMISRSAAVMMILFGLVLLIPKAQQALAALASPLAGSAGARIDRIRNGGIGAQFLIGILLGAVWSPCIGPTLGGAIGLAASGEGLGQAALTMLIFGIGVATVFVALAYGSREALQTRRARLRAWTPWAKPVMGGALLIVGLAIFFHIDRLIESWLLDIMPVWLQDLSVSV